MKDEALKVFADKLDNVHVALKAAIQAAVDLNFAGDERGEMYAQALNVSKVIVFNMLAEVAGEGAAEELN